MMNLTMFYLTLNKSYVILLLEIHFLFSLPAISMLEQRNSRGMIRQPLNVLKSIQLLLLKVLVRLFLTQLIFFQILLRASAFLQINLTYLLRVGFTHPCTQTAIIKLFFAKLNLKIEYPPLYECLIWGYKNANEQLINRAIESLNWEELFEGKNAHDQVYLFNKAILNMFYNFIPNKITSFSNSLSTMRN